MDPEGGREELVKEFRIEGASLVVLGAILLGALVGVFYLGRWTERRSQPVPETTAGLPAAEANQAVETPAKEPTYFDTAAGGEKNAEPQRELSSEPTGSAGKAEAPPEQGVRAEPAPGKYFVQVFAGRDRQAAEGLVRNLGERGYGVRLDTQREGRDTLFKVRVGGYLTQEEARIAAERLKREGESGAWVTRID